MREGLRGVGVHGGDGGVAGREVVGMARVDPLVVPLGRLADHAAAGAPAGSPC